MQKFAASLPSYHDVAGTEPELFYQGMMIGLWAGLEPDYDDSPRLNRSQPSSFASVGELLVDASGLTAPFTVPVGQDARGIALKHLPIDGHSNRRRSLLFGENIHEDEEMIAFERALM